MLTTLMNTYWQWQTRNRVARAWAADDRRTSDNDHVAEIANLSALR